MTFNRMTMAARVSVIALSAMLAACGGGGSGGVASTPTPTPTPTPAPATYTKFADLTGDQTFQTAGIKYQFTGTTASTRHVAPVSKQEYGSGVVARYNLTSDSVTLTAPDGTTATFTVADLVAGTNPNVKQFRQVNGTVTQSASLAAPTVNGVVLSYTRYGVWARSDSAAGTSSGYGFVVGVPTVASDMPTTGKASYAMATSGNLYMPTGNSVLLMAPGTYDLTGSTTTFDVDFAAGSVSTMIMLTGKPIGSTAAGIPVQTITGTGLFGSTKPGFSGSFAINDITGKPGPVVGSFAGAFFGPQAAEAGYHFVVNDAGGAANFSAIGYSVGTKSP